jgi:membrane fusion protein, multidrug efflux system
MIRKILLAVVIVLLVIGGLAGVKALQIKKLISDGKSFVQPPESVSSALVRAEKWQSSLTAIGSITAVQGVTITPEIAGIVHEITFESGAVVSKGDLLVRLDTSLEEAQLRALEAQEDLAKLNLTRERTLRSQNMVSQSELDNAEATLKQAQGNADAIRATIEKKTIRAPFAGRLGIRLVNLGQYMDTGKPIVSLQSLTPVYADFSLPQQDLARLRTGMRVRVTTDTYPGRVFEGTLTAINPDLDQSTRSVGYRCPERSLRRFGLCDRVQAGQGQREAPMGGAPAVHSNGSGARRLCERGVGPQGGRAHRQRRHFQAAKWHGGDRERRPGTQERPGPASIGQLTRSTCP